MKIYGLSRHDLSPAQVRAIRDLHGEDAVVVKDAVVCVSSNARTEYVRAHDWFDSLLPVAVVRNGFFCRYMCGTIKCI
ncbi:MAG: hypothetical protein AAB579_02925 [Patescibacteria group bacterium]